MKKIILALSVTAFLFLLPINISLASTKPTYIGPRGGTVTSTPKAYGFWSFSVIDGGKISRSGQPLLSEFKWLKNNSWQSVVDLRVDGEYKEVSNDQKVKGFKALGFK